MRILSSCIWEGESTVRVHLTIQEMRKMTIEELLNRLEFAIKNNIYEGFAVDNIKHEIENRMKVHGGY